MEKLCYGCKRKKLIAEFNYKNRRLGTRQSQCKECTRAQVRSHYYNKREYYLKKAKIRNLQTRKSIQHFIWDYLHNHPCVDCGEKDIVVLTFDHQNNKLFNISDMTRWRFGLSSVKEEISKCQVRCANCHLRKTAKDYGWKKYGLVAQSD